RFRREGSWCEEVHHAVLRERARAERARRRLAQREGSQAARSNHRGFRTDSREQNGGARRAFRRRPRLYPESLKASKPAPTMNRINVLSTSVAVAIACAPLSMIANTPGPDSWPRWRGPSADGVALKANPPTKWSEEENVKWKMKIPGFGTSTPIVLGDQV